MSRSKQNDKCNMKEIKRKPREDDFEKLKRIITKKILIVDPKNENRAASDGAAFVLTHKRDRK